MTELYVRQDERFANVSILPYSSVWLTVNFHPAGLARVAAERFAYRFGGLIKRLGQSRHGASRVFLHSAARIALG